MAPVSRRVTTACDGCRVRKVRCSGSLPCPQCSHLDLPCRFSPPKGRRRPGVRNRLVHQLRGGTTRNPMPAPDRSSFSSSSPSSSASPPSHHHHYPQPTLPISPPSLPSPTARDFKYTPHPPAVTTVAAIINDPAATSPTTTTAAVSTSLSGAPDSYTPDFFLGLVSDYEEHVYPVNPIITPQEIRTTIAAMHASHENTALVYAFAAVTINLTQTSRTLNGNLDVAAQMTDLIRRCLASHRLADLGPISLSPPSASCVGPTGPALGELPVNVKRIMTCIFLEISLMAFRLFQRSFAILREAISMVQTLKIYRYSSDSDSPFASPDDDVPTDPREIARCQRLYWECYIHERFVNVMSGNPAILQPLSTGLPSHDPSIPPHVDDGFRCLISLFQAMDEPFLSYWNAQQDRARVVPTPMTADWVEAKQSELDRHEADTALHSANLTELQRADLLVTRLWLRTLVWQLALSRRLLRSAPPLTAHQGLSLHFPAARLSSELRILVCRLANITSIATHGSGILQKLFEITTTIADVLALPPGPAPDDADCDDDGPSGGQDARSRVEDFVFLVGFLLRFERISDEERGYMRDKLGVLQAVYPDVAFGSLVALT